MQENSNTTPRITLGADVEQSPVGTGSVNFESSVIPVGEVRAASVIEASQPDQNTLGNVRELGTPSVSIVQQSPVQPKAVAKPTVAHTISAAIHVTLNSGLTVLAGRKELKTVDIANPDGSKVKFNFYNPFIRADKDRRTGEGLLRKTFGSIAKTVHSILGREVVYLGDVDDLSALTADGDNVSRSIANFVETTRQSLEDQFYLPPDQEIFDVTFTCNDGSTVTRPLEFKELFSITSWVVDSPVDDNCVVVHTAHFNIGLNVGALYDSADPAVFIRQAVKFMTNHLKAVGLEELLQYTVNYALDSSTLDDAAVRDTLETLLADDGFTVISKSGVEAGKYADIPVNAANKLFGFGTDIILQSPPPAEEEVAA